jgi:plastocyanin
VSVPAVRLMAICVLCLPAFAVTMAIAAPNSHTHTPAHRGKHHTRRHRRRKPAQPAGSAGPANPNSTASGTTAPQGAPGTPSASGSSGSTESPSAPSPGPPSPARVQVIAKEYSFTLSRPEVPAGEVIVELLNRGEDPHNLHLLEPVAGSEAGSFSNTAPGAHADLKLNMRPGSYTLFCSLPGHQAKGMKATLVVR